MITTTDSVIARMGSHRKALRRCRRVIRKCQGTHPALERRLSDLAEQIAESYRDSDEDRCWRAADDCGDGAGTYWGPTVDSVREEIADAWASSYSDEDRGSSFVVDLRVYCADTDEGEDLLVSIPAVEPPCVGDHDHDWCSPHDVVGGLEENPGVQGHGGGVLITEVCRYCAQYRYTDTWADDGHGGRTTEVSFGDADAASEAWVEDEDEDEE